MFYHFIFIEDKIFTQKRESNNTITDSQNDNSTNIKEYLELDPEGFDPDKIIPNGTVEIICFGNPEEMEIYMEHFEPTDILLLDSQLSYIRCIEVYNARSILLNPDRQRLSVKLLFYEDSSEKFNYMNVIQKEKKAFDSIIRIKKNLMLRENDPLLEEKAALRRIQKMQKFSSAMGGKRQLEVDELVRTKIIAVDVREFSSSLPQYLYDEGFWVVPLTLNVGDFVLSDKIAVEKKAVSTHDLHTSLNSGRLLKQITLMSKWYEQIILLLEFDDSIKYRLKEMYDYADYDKKNVNNQSVFAKLTLLVMNFPKVNVIWSKNPQETAKIFLKIKHN
jgi:DNA excision repair protein ERCC-4